VPCDNSSHELARSRARCGESIRPVLWRVSVCLLAAAVLALLGSAGSVKAQGDPAVAALQIALHARNLYRGSVDGIAGPQTASAVRRFQRKKRVPVTGVIGARTRLALGRLGRHRLGSRVLQPDAVGWDVSALQFLLAWHGFPSGRFDGRLGPHTGAAIRRFQRWAGLTVDGLAGPATLRALRVPPAISPILLRWPLNGRLGDGFGPRGRRFHAAAGGSSSRSPTRPACARCTHTSRTSTYVWVSGWTQASGSGGSARAGMRPVRTSISSSGFAGPRSTRLPPYVEWGGRAGRPPARLPLCSPYRAGAAVLNCARRRVETPASKSSPSLRARMNVTR
jgi:Putative peptidoglycan binding domain